MRRSDKSIMRIMRLDGEKQFAEAKLAEYKSWKENDVFELIDMRKYNVTTYVSQERQIRKFSQV